MGYKRLQRVSWGKKEYGVTRGLRGFKRLQGGTRGYRRLKGVKRGYKKITRGYKGLQEVTRGFRGLQMIKKDYKGLQRVTGGVEELRGYKRFKEFKGLQGL